MADRDTVIRMLRLRAELMARTRRFFAARDVLEVDTPVLGNEVVVEATLDPIACSRGRYLLCSPEGPMKRLLAAGSGSIYQFAHAFRDREIGPRHDEEFTMLEWYRVGLDHHALMDEVEALVRELLDVEAAPFARQPYREVFLEHARVDPFATSMEELCQVFQRLGIDTFAGIEAGSLDDALDLLLVTHIQEKLGAGGPLFVTEFPPSQAALAQVREGVACRFELYVDGLELCNGYDELTDVAEQARRFEGANREREARGLAALPVDRGLLAALDAGLAGCAGVALGFDRLLMLAGGVDAIDAVRGLPFSSG